MHRGAWLFEPTCKARSLRGEVWSFLNLPYIFYYRNYYRL
jgi:hypothetical protein